MDHEEEPIGMELADEPTTPEVHILVSHSATASEAIEDVEDSGEMSDDGAAVAIFRDADKGGDWRVAWSRDLIVTVRDV